MSCPEGLHRDERPTLAEVDRDEALTEAIAELCGSHARGLPAPRGARRRRACWPRSRRPAPAAAEHRPTSGCCSFGLRFEQLQATFYTQAEEMGDDRQDGRGQAGVGADARRPRARAREDHQVGARAQGRSRRRRSTSARRTRPTRRSRRTAVAMEDLTVALLAGVTPQRPRRGLTAALFGLLTVEARHAAWARHIVGAHPAPQRLRRRDAAPRVQCAVARTHFIVAAAADGGAHGPEVHGVMRAARRAAFVVAAARVR